MIRHAVALHHSRLNLKFRELDSRESTAMSWCMNLDHEMFAHPQPTRPMTAQHGMMLRGYVDELLKATLQEGISLERAIECCRSLVNLTINDAIVNARTSSEPKRDLGDSAAEPRVWRKAAVGLILAGVRSRTRRSDRPPRRPTFVDGAMHTR